MYHMLTCFNLKPGVSLDQFCEAYQAFVDHMLSLNMIAGSDPVGVRDSASPLDTDTGRTHTHFALMHFSNKAQSEHAYALLKTPPKDAHSAHVGAYRLATDMVFLAWEDNPQGGQQRSNI